MRLAASLLLLGATGALAGLLAPVRLPTRRRAPAPACAARTFAELGVQPEVRDALGELGVHEPNELQVQAIPALAGRTDLILGAQTGAGKTLAYLIPLMQTLKADENASGMRARPKRPRALVLAPTRELALQVREVARGLARALKLSVVGVHGGVPEGAQKRMLSWPVDLVVATPGRLLQLMDRAHVYLGDVRHVVIDEVDTMLSSGFGDELDRILAVTTRDLAADARAAAAAAAATAAGRVQHVAVGATHPDAASALYAHRLPSARRLMVAGVHTTPPTLKQNFVTCTGASGKVDALRALLRGADGDGRPGLGRLVIFCNSQQSARFVDHTLVEDGYATANYHGAVPPDTRRANFASFIGGESHILVTTDLAARGLDGLDVDHVAHFDFPKRAEDYLHRCGRTARAGKRGTSHALVTKHDTELVRAIRAADAAGADVVEAGDRQLRASSSRIKPARPGASVAFPDARGVGGGVGARPVRGATPDRARGGGRGRGAGARGRTRSPGGPRVRVRSARAR